MPSGDIKRQEKVRRQDEFLAELTKTGVITTALESLGIPKNTYKEWRKGTDVDSSRFVRLVEPLKWVKPQAEDAPQVPDFLTFRRKHFAYYDLRSKKVVRSKNNWYQQDAVKHLGEHNRLIMVLPPGHIKTTLWSIEKPVHDVFADRDFRSTIVQKNQDEAAKVVQAVQERLECDYYHNLADRLIWQKDEPIICPVCLYAEKAPFKAERGSAGAKWGAYGFKVAGRSHGEKDDTYQAKGVGGQIQGVRADRITLDDVQDPMQATKSQKDSDELVDWTNKVILGRIYDHQQLVVLANFFADNDFAHKLIDAHPDWPVINYPAVTDFEEQKVLCPEVWTFKGLEAKRKEVGEDVWHYTWMQEEGSLDTQVFQKEALEAAKDTDYVLGEVPAHCTHVFLGCDPAIRQFCSICVWGLDVRTGQRYLIDIFNEKGLRTFQNIQNAILDHTRAYAPRVAAIELANVQASISNDPTFVREMRNLGCRVATYNTRTEMGARAEHDSFDISSIGGLFDAGLVTLPYGGTDDDRSRVDAYVHQLLQWKPGIKYLVRDMVMSTLFAESEAFPIAQRGVKEPGTHVSRAPRWAQNSEGSWPWRRKQRVS